MEIRRQCLIVILTKTSCVIFFRKKIIAIDATFVDIRDWNVNSSKSRVKIHKISHNVDHMMVLLSIKMTVFTCNKIVTYAGALQVVFF